MVFGTVGPKAADAAAGGLEPACIAVLGKWNNIAQRTAAPDKKGAALRRVRRVTGIAV